MCRPQNVPAQVEETTDNVPIQEEDPVSSSDDDEKEKIKDDYSFKEKTLSSGTAPMLKEEVAPSQFKGFILKGRLLVEVILNKDLVTGNYNS